MRALIRILFAAVMLLATTVSVYAQSEQTKVTLKNGITVVGVVKSFNPVSHMEIEIGGTVTRIEAADIVSVEKVTSAEAKTDKPAPAANLPREKMVNIAGVEVKFVLVDGGTFTYGYDGPGSTVVDSEPKHEVILSPFYVSQQPVKQSLVLAVMGENKIEGFTFVKDKDESDKYRMDENTSDIAFFNLVEKGGSYINAPELYVRRQYMQYSPLLPAATTFLNKAKAKTTEKELAIMTETQWACVNLQYLDVVSVPFHPEVTMAVNMNAKEDPVGMSPLFKGCDYFIPRIVAFDNRKSISAYTIKERSKEIRLGKSGHAIGPMHLVLPAK